MPPFVTAHTFCASRDGPRKSGRKLKLKSKEEIGDYHAFFRDN